MEMDSDDNDDDDNAVDDDDDDDENDRIARKKSHQVLFIHYMLHRECQLLKLKHKSQ